MDDLVSREAVKRWLERWNGYIDMDIIRRMQCRVIDIPQTQPERKKGHWFPDNRCYYETRYICSNCKLPFRVETFMMKPSWRFCPNCGAKMNEV